MPCLPAFCKGCLPREDDVEEPARLDEPNPPEWPASVVVVEADDRFHGNKQELFDCIFSKEGKYSAHPWRQDSKAVYGGYFDERGREFSEERTVVLLKPGVHGAKLNVGYYMSVAGLGQEPDDVELACFECLNGVGADGVQSGASPGALCNFWRSVENLATGSGRDIYYFVSQASPLRRVHIRGQLRLTGSVGGGHYDWGYASGGFTADSRIDGGVELGGQQQWFNRNTEIGSDAVFANGAWSNVMVGTVGGYDFESSLLTEVAASERIAEKPRIVYEEESNKYVLVVPCSERSKRGVTSANRELERRVDFTSVFVADTTATAQVINKKLADGKHVVLTPGIYRITEPIRVSRSQTVLLGLGLATLQPDADAGYMDSLVFVEDGLEGVRISGLMLQAGPKGCDALLKWGTSKAVSSEEPGYLQDLFCRVGGVNDSLEEEVRTNKMVQINSSNVVGDNLWLWRADHEAPDARGVKASRNKVDNALEVNGDGVIMYGLFCEHALQHQVVWKGEDGMTFFFQCELPYDVTQENFGDCGFAGYFVADHVKTHRLEGGGVYCYFRDEDVQVQSGFRIPAGAPGIRLTNASTVFLNGRGGIQHVVNSEGPGCSQANRGPCRWSM